MSGRMTGEQAHLDWGAASPPVTQLAAKSGSPGRAPTELGGRFLSSFTANSAAREAFGH